MTIQGLALVFWLCLCCILVVHSQCVSSAGSFPAQPGYYYDPSLEPSYPMVACAPNSYNLIDSCGPCLACPPGSTTIELGAMACTNATTLVCPAGSGQKISTTPGCYQCSPGTYNDGTGLTCLACAAATAYMTTSCPSTTPFLCAAGTGNQFSVYSGGSTTPVCYYCDPGFVNDGTNAGCVQCSPVESSTGTTADYYVYGGTICAPGSAPLVPQTSAPVMPPSPTMAR